jgi:hypothetical protein
MYDVSHVVESLFSKYPNVRVGIFLSSLYISSYSRSCMLLKEPVTVLCNSATEHDDEPVQSS